MRWSDETLHGVFWGGLGAGLASVIPLLDLGNCFCCLWAWLAGAAALIIARRGGAGRTDRPRPQGVGAAAGLWAGLVAGTLEVFGRLVAPPTPAPSGLSALLGEDYPSELTALLDQGPDQPLLLLLATLTRMLIFALFGLLGAVLAERLWPERAPGSLREDDGHPE